MLDAIKFLKEPDSFHKKTMFGPPKTQQSLITTGNETFDKFLGGGLLHSSLNLFERQGPCSRILDSVWNKSLASATLATRNNLIVVNFNTSIELVQDEFISSLPLPRKVKSELLYKDIRGRSSMAQIKIAWRYSSRSSSPPDGTLKVDQVDFGLPIMNESIGRVKIINIKKEEFSMAHLFCTLDQTLKELNSNNDSTVNIIVKDLLHPFSPMIDSTKQLCKLLFALRCFARSLVKGAILVSYDIDLFDDHHKMKQLVYNLVDLVVTFFSFETGQSKLTGYKNTDGTMDYVKVPKINSFGLHFQRELSDWGYRFTRNHRFFVVDELSLPPCLDDDDEDRKGKKTASDLTNIDHKRWPLKKVSPLEDFKEVATDFLAKEL